MACIHHQRRIRGFSLVEALVALGVGMITVLVIMQTLASAEGQRRAITGGSDTNTSGTIGLQIIQRDLLNAGFGMSIPEGTTAGSDLYSTCYGVPSLAYNAQRAQGDNTLSGQDIVLPAGSIAPVTRFDSQPGFTAPPPAYLTALDPANPGNPTGFDPDTDILQVTFSGSSSFVGSGVTLVNQNAATTPFNIVVDPTRKNNVSLRNGIHQGDLVLVGNSPPDGTSCVFAQVTNIPTTSAGVTRDECGVVTGSVGDTTIWHGTGGFNNWHLGTPPNCAADTARWNKAGSPNLGINLANNPRLFSLGAPDRFAMRAYGIRGGRLTVCNPLLQDCTDSGSWQSVADGIVSMRVMFAIDGANGGLVDGIVTPPTYNANGQITANNEWTRNLPGGMPVWNQMRSVHIALVARSKTLQRTQIDNAVCQPSWAGFPQNNTLAPAALNCSGAGANNAAGEIWLATTSDGANWDRYSTRVFETSVPLRSLFWSNN